MYQALYRKYRPQTFDDVVGQGAVTTTLKTQLESGKLSHAYLFTGSRGTGKTSSAKILAKAVNCEDLQNGNPCGVCKACRSIDSGACINGFACLADIAGVAVMGIQAVDRLAQNLCAAGLTRTTGARKQIRVTHMTA